MITFNRHLLKLILLSAAAVPFASAQTATFTSMSMASYGPLVSPDSIAAGFGTNLATATSTGTIPLTTNLGNAQVIVTDSAGMKFTSPLYMVSPTQINYLIPANAALGKATVAVTSGANSFQGPLLVSNIAPAIATANNNGMGVPAAQIVRQNGAGMVTMESPFTTGTSPTTFVTKPISVATATDKVYLVLYGTGIRRHSLNPVKASIGTVGVPVLYAGAQSQFPGLDQVNIGPLPQTLAGKGAVNLVLTVDGVPANTVALNFQ
ncbi:MAG: hypothetical protein M3Z09_10715 [Acidobacteriota bacterium]|nr:hypothetical protein [Acidobacteriota bacterium]